MKEAIHFFEPIKIGERRNIPLLKETLSNAGNVIYRTNDGYDVYISNDGLPYNGIKCNRPVEVTFLNDLHTQKVSLSNLQKGELKNYFVPNKYNGYTGCPSGTYPSDLYDRWNNILRRLYSGKIGDPKWIKYKDTLLDERWRSFDNFAKWYLYNISLLNQELGINYEVDKDIIANVFNQPSMYGPDTCLLIPCKLNSIIGSIKGNSEFPGVIKNKKRFTTTLTIDGIKRYFGTYDTPEEAYEIYKRVKKDRIMEVTNYFHSIGALTDFAYEMLERYEVKY